MCASCSAQPVVPDLQAVSPANPAEAAETSASGKFAALRNPDCRFYLIGTMLSMMADNIEHVITYLVLWQTFHSPALAGFAVISHWTPHLLLSVWFGSLADRYDCRRVIQVAQMIFMAVSATWGVLFLTGSLTVTWAVVLLVFHGLASAVWGPAEQLMLHDMVGPVELPSAVRLNATARSLGLIGGPIVGSALLLGLHPTVGIFTNIAFFLPMTLWLLRTPYTGHLRERVTAGRMSLSQAARVLREVAGDPRLISMVVLAGMSSLFVGVILQSTMPAFAQDFGLGAAGLGYGALLVANGAGGVLGGLVLEATGWVRPSLTAAFGGTLLFGLAAAAFAWSPSFPVALVLLFLGGVGALISLSVGQTVVQLLAPADRRGQVIGVYGMSANGLRAGTGITVGVLAGSIGLHQALGLNSLVLCGGTVLLYFYVRRSGTLRIGYPPAGR